MASNDVAVGKANPAGVLYWAPLGTPLPTDPTTPLNSAFKPVGLLNEDGLTNAADMDKTEVADMDGNTVLTIVSSYKETMQFVMLETNENSLKMRYGTENVSTTGNITKVDHKVPSGERLVLVADILMAGNDKRQRKIMPDATLGEVGDVQYHSSDAITYDVTYSLNKSDLIDGATMRDYIAPITTAAAAVVTPPAHHD